MSIKVCAISTSDISTFPLSVTYFVFVRIKGAPDAHDHWQYCDIDGGCDNITLL